jgi:hypothetical protein
VAKLENHMTLFLRFNITAFIILLPIYSLFGQEKADLGFILSLNDESRYGIEYRLPKNEQLTYKFGITHGTFQNSWISTGIISASDSVVVQQTVFRGNNQWEVRIGGERKLGESLFSLGADLNLAYLRHEKRQFNSPLILDKDGNWIRGNFVANASQIPPNSPNNVMVVGDPDYANIKQHFFVPSMRITFNLNVPISDAFYFNCSVVTRFGIPIYMGATEVTNHNRIAIGSPPVNFDIGTTAAVGLRYIIGTFKDKVQPPPN